MAENKQYITQTLEKGSVMISEDVIAKIVLDAWTEVEGYAGLTNKAGMDIIDLIGGKNWGKSIKVVIDENNQLSIACNVLVHYGHSLLTVANAIQEAAVNGLNAVLGLEDVTVHVNVCGIVRQ